MVIELYEQVLSSMKYFNSSQNEIIFLQDLASVVFGVLLCKIWLWVRFLVLLVLSEVMRESERGK